MRVPKRIMIHHTGVSHAKNSDQFAANNSYHQKKWDFKSSLGFYLGYTYEISKLGYLHNARVCGEQTAACTQNNMNSGDCIHIALDGNFEDERPFPNQIYKLRDLLRLLCKKYKIKSENIYFHNQFSNTKCPGKNMDLDFIRSLIVLKPEQKG